MQSTIRSLAILGAVLAVPAYAQVAPSQPNRTTTAPAVTAPDSRTGTTTMPPRAESTPPAATIDNGTRTSAAPVAGANSFTEAQAKNRIEAAGFTGVDQLSKDDQGIWRGRAQRNGQQVSVSLDYQGNVSTR
ncbi:MAG: PepSY domain-containing protein [Acetobacteraceae bacterium]|nr:MAG: PepSY domain-containing protein [Acetobacteraceae bacterium]